VKLSELAAGRRAELPAPGRAGSRDAPHSGEEKNWIPKAVFCTRSTTACCCPAGGAAAGNLYRLAAAPHRRGIMAGGLFISPGVIAIMGLSYI